jgi:hypothetical protein
MPIAHPMKTRRFAHRSLARAVIAGAMASVVSVGTGVATAGPEPSSHATGHVVGWITSKATGRPVPGAVVTIPTFRVRTTSDHAGAFALPAAIPTRWPYVRLRVVIVAKGFGTWTIHGVPLYPDDTLELGAQLTSRAFDHAVLTPEERAASSPRAVGSAPGSRSGNTCSGWSSNLVPPQTIRVAVGDSVQTETSETIPFVEYMTHVLPDEWIASWDSDALGAGAAAVKTYAWYRAQPGHAYTSGSGCADVTDDTRDQVYDPNWTDAHTNRAVYATLGSILHRSDAVFLSQYWSGGSTSGQEWLKCQYVDTGTFAGRMSQWGTQVCATQNHDVWTGIVKVFYPDTTWTWANNRLLNPSAEDPAMYMWSYGTNATVTRIEGGAAKGSWYWDIKSTNGQNASMVQEVTADHEFDTSRAYTLTMKLLCPTRYTTACPITMRLVATASDGTYVTEEKSLSVPNDGAWHGYTLGPVTPGISHESVTTKAVSKREFGLDGVTLTAPFGGP